MTADCLRNASQPGSTVATAAPAMSYARQHAPHLHPCLLLGPTRAELQIALATAFLDGALWATQQAVQQSREAAAA